MYDGREDFHDMTDSVLAENIANELRRDILTGKLMPGNSVKERDYALELGVSRTPVREAIRSIATEGLITLRTSRSPIVSSPAFQEVKDDIDVMRTLEVRCGELACQEGSKEDIEKIIAIQRRLAAEYKDFDPLDRFELDMEFHCAIAEASHNRSLVKTHREYLRRLWRIRFLSANKKGDRERSMGQHYEIALGLANRDAALVTHVVSLHVDHIIENIREYFETNEQ